MSDNTPADTPLSAAHRHLDLIADHLGLDASHRQELRVRHDLQVRVDGDRLYYIDAHNRVRLDADRGYADLATGPWIAAMEREHPEMFPGKVPPQPAETPPAPTVDWSKATMTAKMTAARQGDASAMSYLDIQPAAAQAPAYTGATALMLRARSGDPSALAEFDRTFLKRSGAVR